MCRLYSGHGNERQEILADAKKLDLKAKTSPSVSEVERILSNFQADWRNLEKFEIRIDEPSSLWSVVYTELTAVCSNRSDGGWDLFKAWLANLVLSAKMNNLQPGEDNRVFKAIADARTKMKEILQSAGVNSMNADGASRNAKSKAEREVDAIAQLSQLQQQHQQQLQSLQSQLCS